MIIYKGLFLLTFIFTLSSCNFFPPNITGNTTENKPLSKEQLNEQFVKMPNSEKYRFVAGGFKIKGGIRVEDDDPTIVYSDNWTQITDSNASGGTFKRSTGQLLKRTEEGGVNDLVPNDGINDGELTAYINQNRWSIVQDTNASGGTYIKTNGMYETRIENNSPSIKYNGIWQQKSFTSSPSQLPYSDGNLYNVENNSNDTSLVYTQTLSPWQTGHNRTFVYSEPLTIDDKSSAITYTGTWNKNSGLTYTSNSDNTLEANFTGTNIHIFASKTPYSGKIKISVREKDTGTLERTIDKVDLYASITQTAVDVGQIQGLNNKEHIVKVQILSEKNTSSTSTTFEFDKMLVYPAVQYTFSGSAIRYSALKDSKGGKVDIVLDSSTVQRFDLYSPTSSFETIMENLALSSTNHRITVEGTAQTNPNSLSNVINVQSFSTYPSLNGIIYGSDIVIKVLKRPDFGKANFIVDGTSKQDIDLYSETEKIDYIKIANLDKTYHLFSLAMNGKKNDASTGYGVAIDSFGKDLPEFDRSYNGSDIMIYGVKGPNCGKVDFYVGKNLFYAGIDMYSPQVQYNQPLMIYGGLDSLQELKFIPSLTKNDASTGYDISVDYMGYGLPSFRTIFFGNSFTLYGNKGPDKGKASIILDNKNPPYDYIDLYSPTVEYDAPLITYKDLVATGHIVDVKHNLDRNSASTGDVLEFDGYDYTNNYHPTITSITPDSASQGEKITIFGTKFPTDKAESYFKIYFGSFDANGTVVQVKDLTATPTEDATYPEKFSEQIDVLIPANAVSGKIAIFTAKGGYVYSDNIFNINKPPVADFSISQIIGTTSTNFTVDASASGDYEDDLDPDKDIQLKINWGDGNETAYGSTRTFNHTYSSEGTKVINVTVKDSLNREIVATKTVYIGTPPATAGWTKMTAYPDDGKKHLARKYGSAVELGGKIFFLGGNNNGLRNMFDMFDPETNTWNKNNTVTLAVSPRSTKSAGLGVYNGKILAYTAVMLNQSVPSGLDIYDPSLDPALNSNVAADSYPWDAHTTESEDPVTDRNDPFIVVDKSKVYLGGGCNSQNTYYATFLTKFSVYDTISRTWDQSLPDMSTGFLLGRAEMINGKLYVLAGFKDYYSLYNKVLNDKMRIFNFTTKTWSESTSTMPSPRYDFSSAIINGKFYAIGGIVKSGTSYAIASTVDVYDPIADSWSTIAMPTANQVAEEAGTGYLNSFYTISGIYTKAGSLTALVNRYTLP